MISTCEPASDVNHKLTPDPFPVSVLYVTISEVFLPVIPNILGFFVLSDFKSIIQKDCSYAGKLDTTVLSMYSAVGFIIHFLYNNVFLSCCLHSWFWSKLNNFPIRM